MPPNIKNRGSLEDSLYGGSGEGGGNVTPEPTEPPPISNVDPNVDTGIDPNSNMQHAVLYYMGSDGRYWIFTVNASGNWQQTGSIDEGELPSGASVVNTMPSGYEDDTGNTFYDLSNAYTEPEPEPEPELEFEPIEYDPTPVGERTDVGLAPLTEEDWMGKSLKDQAQYILNLKYQGEVPDLANMPDYPEVEGDPQANDLKYLMSLLEYQPLKGGIDETKAGFLSEQYGGGDISFAESLTGRQAEISKQTDIYGLQKEAGKIGQKMSSVYGGGGSGMRAGISDSKALGKGFETVGDVYRLKKDTAELGYEEGIYGLTETAEQDWETNWQTFFSGLPTATG